MKDDSNEANESIRPDNRKEVEVDVDKAKRNESEEEAVEVKPSRDELLNLLHDMIKNSENLPMHVRYSFITYIEFESLMLLVYAILKAPSN